MDIAEVAALLQLQRGVISRRQVLACGGTDNDVRRMVRRRLWFRVLEGGYVDHNGPLSWEQRAWVAVLFHWPAALRGASALVAHGLRAPRFLGQVSDGDRSARSTGSAARARSASRPGRSGAGRQAWPQGPPVEVAIDVGRTADRQPGIDLRRIVDFDGAALMALAPPRVRVESAVLDVAARAADEAGAVGVLADAVQARRTTPQRLLAALGGLPRLRHRRFLVVLLTDIASGAWSALEHRYLIRVERRHGLPAAERQRRERRRTGVVFRDVDYVRYGLIVELDGRLSHEWSEDGWHDLDRDIDAAEEQRITVRARWQQVLEPCRLAASLVRILRARGWHGEAKACGPSCQVGRLLVQTSITEGSRAESA